MQHTHRIFHSIRFVHYICGALLCLGVVACTGNGRMVEQANQDAKNGTLTEGNLGGKKGPKVKPRWQGVLAMKDKKTARSKSFKIAGNEWKIKWKTKPLKKGDDDEFIIILRDKANPDVQEIVVNVNGADEDFAYLEGKGEYYLSVNTSQQYEITVEENK